VSQVHDDPKAEAASIMGWLDRRLVWANRGTLPLYVMAFKKMWFEAFGTLDTIPQDYKAGVSAQFHRLKEGDKR
jgi:hypothetical protein